MKINGEDYIVNDDVVRKTFGKYDKSLGDRRCFYEELVRYKGEAKKREIDAAIASGRYFLRENGYGMHTICRYDKVSDAKSKLYSIIKVLSENGKKELDDLGIQGFPYPKPLDFIKQLLDAGTSSQEPDIVLDFFAGSSTTAHGVLKLNAEDGGNRRFFMIQLPEKNIADSEPAKDGYDTICQLGEERIRRAGSKIKGEIEDANVQLGLDEEPQNMPDIGFRVFKLDESSFEKPQPGQLVLDVVKSDRSELDIVFEMMLKWGLELTLPVEKSDAAGYPIWSVACDELVCCMSRGLTIKALEAIADMEPRRVLILDSVLDDTLKLNAVQIFKHAGERMGCEIELRTV